MELLFQALQDTIFGDENGKENIVKKFVDFLLNNQQNPEEVYLYLEKVKGVANKDESFNHEKGQMIQEAQIFLIDKMIEEKFAENPVCESPCESCWTSQGVNVDLEIKKS